MGARKSDKVSWPKGASGVPETAILMEVGRRAAALKRLALRIHAHPEVGYEEKQAAAWQVALLRQWGFRVEAPVAGVETAYRVVAGKGHPCLCLMAEYDALPGLGHACGHNLISGAALGAFAALASVMERGGVPGCVQLVGTPAEESRGGKVRLIAGGILKEVDAALMAHPSWRTAPDTGSSAIVRFRVTFEGLEAHAAASPHLARNALDAVQLLFAGIGAWRQQLPETSRIHGVVSNGGVAPNIIPGLASCEFFLRSPRDATLEMMRKRFYDIARGAALMTGTKAHIEPWLVPYKSRWPNGPLNGAYIEAAQAVGLQPVPTNSTGRASSDFGDVSQAVPGAHVYFGIARHEVAGHSPEFREAAATPYALDRMLLAAQALAQVGWRYMTDADLRAKARKDFDETSRDAKRERRGK